MVKEALKPLGRVKIWAQKTHARLQGYLNVRPHRSLRLTKVKKLGGKPLPSVLRHIRTTLGFMWREKKLLFVLGLIYAVANYLVMGGIPQADFVALKEGAQDVFLGDWGQAGVVATLFVTTVAGAVAGAGTELQQFLGALVAFVFWLAIVWAVRMRTANQNIKARDALYNCCGPLIPSLVILMIIAIQLLPAALGIFAYTTAQAGGFISDGVEAMVFALAAGLLCLLSAYWVAASVVALVVASLPQTYPFHAIAAASQLVIGQRWKLLTHLLAIVVLVLVSWVLVLVPTLALDGWLRFDWLPLVPVATQTVAAFSLVFTTVYAFRLYRSLL